NVTGPGGTIASYSQDLSTDPGSTLWGLASAIPQSVPGGTYAYSFTLTYGGVPFTRQTSFTVVAAPTPTSVPPTPTIPGALPGGRALAISTSGSTVQLAWQPGTGQLGYAVLRLVDGVSTTLASLSPDATSYVDASAPSGLNCYVLQLTGLNPPTYSDL